MERHAVRGGDLDDEKREEDQLNSTQKELRIIEKGGRKKIFNRYN